MRSLANLLSWQLLFIKWHSQSNLHSFFSWDQFQFNKIICSFISWSTAFLYLENVLLYNFWEFFIISNKNILCHFNYRYLYFYQLFSNSIITGFFFEIVYTLIFSYLKLCFSVDLLCIIALHLKHIVLTCINYQKFDISISHCHLHFSSVGNLE